MKGKTKKAKGKSEEEHPALSLTFAFCLPPFYF
jgi:hypothetical protein